MPKSVFIVRTGLQALNAIEALHAHECDPDQAALVLQYSDPRYRRLTERVTALQTWGSIHCVRVGAVRSVQAARSAMADQFRKVRLILQLNRLASKLSGAERCFTAMHCCNFMRHLLNRMGCQRPILLDEGLGQINFLRRFQRWTADGRSERTDAPGRAERWLGYDNRPTREYDVFSAFDVADLAPWGYRRHRYENVRRLFSDAGAARSDYVLWLGTPHFVFGTEDQYVEHARRMHARLQQYGLPLEYTAHRAESDSVLARIAELATIVRSDLPVELRILQEGRIPRVLAGTSSTALPTLDMIFQDDIEQIVVFELAANSDWAAPDLSSDSLFGYLREQATDKWQFEALTAEVPG